MKLKGLTNEGLKRVAGVVKGKKEFKIGGKVSKRWEHTIEIKNEWNSLEKGDMSIAEFCGIVVKKLKEIFPGEEDTDYTLDSIIYALEEMSYSPDEDDSEEFDHVWEDLYDWADVNDVWIRTT